jgi:hypothetical protein
MLLVFLPAMIGCGKEPPVERTEPMPKGRLPTGGPKFEAKLEAIKKKQAAMAKQAE